MEQLVKAGQFFHTKKLYFVPPAVFILLFLFSFYNRNIQIYPKISNEAIEAFNDHNGGGNSQLDQYQNDSNGVTLGYTLKEKLQYPYAGLKLILKEKKRYRDLSAYDLFSIDLEPKTPQDFNIYIHAIIPGFTNEANVLSYRYLLKSFSCQQRMEHFTVPLKAFSVPTWWYVLNKLPDDSLKNETYKEVAEIIIENGYGNQVNIPYAFTLHKLSFQKDMGKRAILVLGACAGWILLYILLFLAYKNRIKSHNKKIVISYEPLMVNNDSDECLNRIITYIAKEYSNPELTVNQIASDVGLLPAKITQILRDKKNYSYKQYLNLIRLNEAKRLLLETDKNIVAIANKVGYNNVTHFNRIFKETEGISPRQFRNSALNNSK